MSGQGHDMSAAEAAHQAASWFVRLQSADASGDDWLAFETWLGASPANIGAYERLEQIWIDVEADPQAFRRSLDLGSQPPGARRARTGSGQTVSRRGWIAAVGALAASLVLAIGVADRPQAPAPGLVLRTAPGEMRQFTLADGTKINLNAGSVVRVSLDRDARRVAMSDAEAVFDVAHDARRPFLITSGDREVRVVGTLFNLRQRAGRMALSVRRGVVEVRPSGAPGAAATRVTVGQQLAHTVGGETTLAADDRSEAAFAWTSGQLIYRDQTLEEVAADLSRRFATQVRADDARTASLRFSGVLVLDNEPAVLRRIEAFAPVKAVRTADGVVLRRIGAGG
jgi:transmembrane sensor